jgi:hypothetical protein
LRAGGTAFLLRPFAFLQTCASGFPRATPAALITVVIASVKAILVYNCWAYRVSGMVNSRVRVVKVCRDVE